MERNNAFLSIALVLSVGFTGCLPVKGTLSPEDKLSVATMALEAGATLSALGRAQLMAAGSYTGCVVMEVVAATLTSASEATLGGAIQEPVLPRVDVDLSACMRMTDKKPEGSDAAEEIKGIYDLYVRPVTGIVMDRIAKSQIKCRDVAIITAAFSYATVALDPILEEIANPDGKFEIPQIPLDLAECS